MSMFTRLWNDDRGAIISTEYVMVQAIIVAGLSGGLVAVRNAVNANLAAVAALPAAVIPTTADLQRQVAVQPPPYAAKSMSQANSLSASNVASASNVNLVVNVQYPASRYDLPAP